MSTVFKDKHGRPWDVALSLSAAKRIDKSDYTEVLRGQPLKASFLQPDREYLQALMGNQAFMFAVIWTIVQPQVPHVLKSWLAGQKVTKWDPDNPDMYAAAELEFCESINGKAKADARDAFLEAASDFFQDHKTALSMLRTEYARMQKKLDEDLKSLGTQLQAVIDEEYNLNLSQLKRELQTRSGKHGKPSKA